jgi:hypothetical protein
MFCCMHILTTSRLGAGRVTRPNIRQHNSRRHNIRGTLRLEGQNIQKYKTSGGTKRLVGQNIRRNKMSGDICTN